MSFNGGGSGFRWAAAALAWFLLLFVSLFPFSHFPAEAFPLLFLVLLFSIPPSVYGLSLYFAAHPSVFSSVFLSSCNSRSHHLIFFFSFLFLMFLVPPFHPPPPFSSIFPFFCLPKLLLPPPFSCCFFFLQNLAVLPLPCSLCFFSLSVFAPPPKPLSAFLSIPSPYALSLPTAADPFWFCFCSFAPAPFCRLSLDFFLFPFSRQNSAATSLFYISFAPPPDPSFHFSFALFSSRNLSRPLCFSPPKPPFCFPS